MSIHQGQYLRKLLKDKGIGVNKIAEKFEVSRTAVYQYFESGVLSDQVQQKFYTHFDIRFEKDPSEEDQNHSRTHKVKNKSIELVHLQREIEHQKMINTEMQKRIQAQEATIEAQQKLINFLSIKKDLDIKLGKDGPPKKKKDE